MKKRLLVFLTGISFELGASLQDHSPSFEISLGKGDSYFGRFYWPLINSLRYGRLPWRDKEEECPKPVSAFYQFCKDLYEENRLTNTTIKSRPCIPLIVHQIWLGSPFPEKYRKWQQTWQSIPGWEYKLWTDKDIEKLNLVNKSIYDASKNYGQRSDIARMEILERFGGLYVDVDFECLNPEMFTTLHKAYDFYAGLEPLDLRKVSVNNALIASVPGHPIVKGYIKKLKNRWTLLRSGVTQEEQNMIIFKTGPAFLSGVVWEYGVKSQHRNIIFPPTFFYPLGFHQAKHLGYPIATVLKGKVSKPETLAIHWWAGSWRKPQAHVPEL